MEEIGAEIHSLKLLGVLEHLFTFDGTPGHEIVFVCDAGLLNESHYHQAETPGIESNGATLKVSWFSLKKIKDSTVKTYPSGMHTML